MCRFRSSGRDAAVAPSAYPKGTSFGRKDVLLGRRRKRHSSCRDRLTVRQAAHQLGKGYIQALIGAANRTLHNLQSGGGWCAAFAAAAGMPLLRKKTPGRFCATELGSVS
ncbi:MAG: hypothetical protein ABW092_09130 [Candidatus Thiodiazotropha sp.]